MSEVLSYDNLQVSPYRITQLQELSIVKKVNDHTRLRLTGIVPEELTDRYVKMTEADTNIEIKQVNDESQSTPLFAGVVQHIEVKAIRGVYYIEIEAISHTYKLDMKRRTRSFQNAKMTYAALLETIIADYPWVDFMDIASGGSCIGAFTLQYQETDWEFLQRMASRLSTGLVAASVFDKPKFYFGIPDGSVKGALEDYNYRVKKNLSNYRTSYENGRLGVDESDFIFYEVETNKVMELGNEITFKGRSLHVCEIHTEMRNSIVKHVYTLCPRQGLYQNIRYNNKIAGISLQGEVISLTAGKVKVHLDMDPEQKIGGAHWFPYSSIYTAEGSTGWYCMPELGDHVMIYFPSMKEEEGIAISSVRKDTKESRTNKVSDPNIKYFRTASGKELMFSPEEIVITGKDGEVYIRLHDIEGIEIVSKKPIRLKSDEDIVMDSQKSVIIRAEKELKMQCKDSVIKMLEGSTVIRGKDVKTN
ncbi:contractile injection system protein, VgrG/Pvc8 family [Paenibacillus alvei]|uniref:contractile injection system protein, VgrG/Pvc8 family n=1 Tax=Paenibacillus alvei TaxID=44250 RepID=UPI0022801894|nr:contractile injection system protein, VgrG/Pvc8 family [Paenibacillus alvei]